ncbi:hypothetical protein Fcan01_17453 [Folsomia candida]|uniref:Uncharacterized protein n=1 Tax=Folsomia candida TaxID=158441 RepID=A0A226DSG2_FOLCA|nr:hypothetical protein Fcan01_17453 [Folsomia candida]
MWILLGLLLILIPVPSNCVWNKPDLFRNCHIILFTVQNNPSRGNASNFPPPYLITLLRSNPSSPITLAQLRIKNPKLVDILNKGNSPYGFPTYSRMTLVVFLHLTPTKFGGRPYHRAIFKLYNPSFLFQHCSDMFTTSNYASYEERVGTASLVLFNFKIPNKIFIPCIFCAVSSTSKVLHSIGEYYSLPEIDRAWARVNNNLQQKRVVLLGNNILIVGNQCETKRFNVKLSNFRSCTIVSLSKILNFTVATYRAWEPSIYYVYFNLVTGKFRRTYVVYHVRREMVQYGFVTPFPTAFNGMSVFLSPFDNLVWLILFAFCVTITLIVGLTEAKNLVRNFIPDFLDVVCILLGQVNGDSLKMFHKKNWTAVTILTVWFLGGAYIIMGNLYTGSIFSFLSGVKLPIFPSNLEDLVASTIPLFTTSYHSYAHTSGGYSSNLKKLIIPQHKNLFGNRSSFFATLERLDEKLFFIRATTEYQYFKFLANIDNSRPLKYLNKSISTRKTFAIMDVKGKLILTSRLLRWNGSRLIIPGGKDTPLSIITFGAAKKSFLLPIFLNKLRQLSSSGLEERWNKMENVYYPLRLQYLRNNSTFPVHFARAMAAEREPIMFSEADPISLESVVDTDRLFKRRRGTT